MPSQKIRAETEHTALAAAEHIVLPIDGMTCVTCAGRIEKALGALPSVRASVDLVGEQADVEFDPTLISPAAIAAAVKRVGYDVPLEVRALAVSGMTCATCAGRVEKALLGVPGVVSVTANLAAEKASVEGIGGALRASDLIAAVRRAGYGAELLTGDLDRDKEIAATEDRRLSHETRRVAAAIIFSSAPDAADVRRFFSDLVANHLGDAGPVRPRFSVLCGGVEGCSSR